MYYFTDFSNYEPEFGYSDKIIISAGINDLTRKRLTPEQKCDVVLPQLRRFRALYPNSKFIIKSEFVNWRMCTFSIPTAFLTVCIAISIYIPTEAEGYTLLIML